MPKFNANLTMMFNEVAFIDRFAAAAQAGFKGVEFLFPYPYEKSQLVDVLGETKLQVILFNMPAGDWNAGDRGLACDPGRLTEFQEGVGKAIDYAQALGCRQIHCMAGLRARAINDEKMRETYLTNLRFAGTELAKHNLKLLIEGINTRDIPGFYLNTSRQAFDVMHYAEVPNLSFLYDCYHMQIGEGDLAPTIEKNLGKIGHFQIADTPGRHEPGTGEINYPFLFDHLDRLGYLGWVGCEYRPATTTEAGLGWLKRYQPGEHARE
ncbi:MAG: 2-oxo-tetronate isomerase [Myxococcales bacterium]